MEINQIITQEKLKEMAISFTNSSLAKDKIDNARIAFTKNSDWINNISLKLNNSKNKRAPHSDSTLQILTPDFLNKMFKTLTESEVYKAKLERAKLVFNKGKFDINSI